MVTEPIHLWVLQNEVNFGLVERRGKILVCYSEVAIEAELPNKNERVVELLEVHRCATCRFRDLSQRLPCTADHIDEDGSAEFLVRVSDGTGFCHRHEPLPEVPTVEQADQELRAAGVDVDGFEERLRDKIQKARGNTP